MKPEIQLHPRAKALLEQAERLFKQNPQRGPSDTDRFGFFDDELQENGADD